jgi:NAD(P)-dependent dehydrogenase (short-subunit alcohol dehydrogenase family)
MRCIVTGSSGGIGQAIAEQLARRGGNQLLIVDRDAERGTAMAAMLSQSGARASAIAAELTDPGFGTAVAQAARDRMGGIDALVSAAGTIAPEGKMEELSLDLWQLSFAINTTPLFLLAQAAFADLKESRGAIVAIASSSASHPVPGLGGYSASKAALVMLVRQLALEWGPHGIRANSISPGPTATSMAPAYADPDVRARRAATLPLRRISETEDIANAVDYLLGPGGRGITGHDLVIDGGMALTTMQLSGANLGRGAK